MAEQVLYEDEKAERGEPSEQPRSRSLRHTLRMYIRNNINPLMCYVGWSLRGNFWVLLLLGLDFPIGSHKEILLSTK